MSSKLEETSNKCKLRDVKVKKVTNVKVKKVKERLRIGLDSRLAFSYEERDQDNWREWNGAGGLGVISLILIS